MLTQCDKHTALLCEMSGETADVALIMVSRSGRVPHQGLPNCVAGNPQQLSFLLRSQHGREDAGIITNLTNYFLRFKVHATLILLHTLTTFATASFRTNHN